MRKEKVCICVCLISETRYRDRQEKTRLRVVEPFSATFTRNIHDP